MRISIFWSFESDPAEPLKTVVEERSGAHVEFLRDPDDHVQARKPEKRLNLADVRRGDAHPLGKLDLGEPPLLAKDAEEVPSFKEAKRAFETRYVVGLLRRCGGNISRAARLAKKDRKDFYDVIRRTGVDPSQFR